MYHPSYQTTINTPIVFAGVAVHKGTHSRIALKPAPADTGIVFRNSQVGNGQSVRALATNVTELDLGTTLSGNNGFKIGVVEHFMAACYGMGLDNVFVDITGDELPIMDGSSEEFCALIEATGLKQLLVARRMIRVLEPVEVSHGKRWARLSPHKSDSLRLTASIDFDASVIGNQSVDVTLTEGVFRRELAFARTFGFSDGLEKLREQGLALGGSLDNAIFIKDNKIVNPEGLRIKDEFVRHKVLDAIGDLALLGGRIAGHYEAAQMGHALNNELARKLLDTPTAWRWEDMPTNDAINNVDDGKMRARV